ncbi:MAG TPA: glycogen synthase GlgA [Kofleriaceae bacterium]
MRILHVASEVAPFAQSGGLADVVAGLPAAQATLPAVTRVGVLVPLYRGVTEKLAAAGAALSVGTPFKLLFGGHVYTCAIRTAQVGAVTYGFVDIPELYNRPGTLYGPGGPGEWPDNHVRFAALGAAAQHAGPVVLDGAIDVLHVHDWQGGPAAVYAHMAAKRPTIIATIHNLAFRGIFPKLVMDELGWPWSMFKLRQLEFYDQVSFLKGGAAFADAVTTVSPQYAKEILTPQFGEALDGFLANDIRALSGIVNGIDTSAWNPLTDSALPAPFSADALAGKAVCRSSLAAELDLPLASDEILVGVIARMASQKGLDLVADCVPHLHRLRMKLVVLGSGEPELEARYRYLATIFANNIRVRIGFDGGLARRIYAGCDLFLMPSRFEPCGLGQLYAMRYGTLPVVHAVGGLVDTVDDGKTGLKFDRATPVKLLSALERASRLFNDRAAVTRMQRSAMTRDLSWSASAREYVALYRSFAH